MSKPDSKDKDKLTDQLTSAYLRNGHNWSYARLLAETDTECGLSEYAKEHGLNLADEGDYIKAIVAVAHGTEDLEPDPVEVFGRENGIDTTTAKGYSKAILLFAEEKPEEFAQYQGTNEDNDNDQDRQGDSKHNNFTDILDAPINDQEDQDPGQE